MLQAQGHAQERRHPDVLTSTRENFLEVGSSKTTVRRTDTESETIIGDWKEVAGMMMPFSVDSGQKRPATPEDHDREDRGEPGDRRRPVQDARGQEIVTRGGAGACMST
jgi:hypothetical protein